MRLLTISIIAFLCTVFSLSSATQIEDSEFIDIIKKTKAASLEHGLPDKTISLWIESTFRNSGKTKWEVNDCGEGGDGRSSPICVEIQIPQQDGYYLHICSIVGDISGQVIGRPHLRMVYFLKSEGFKIIDVINVKSISEAIQMYKTDLKKRIRKRIDLTK